MWARIIDQDGIETIAEVVAVNPATMFTAEVAAMFVPATPDMVYRAEKRDGVWVPPPPPDPAPETPPEPPAPAKRTVVTPVEYFSMYSPLEEFGIREAAKGDSTQAKILAIFLRRLDHPSLTQIDLKSAQVRQGHELILAMGLITVERKAEIEEGI